MAGLYYQLEKDVRYIEGLKACFNCGICTAICPAAENMYLDILRKDLGKNVFDDSQQTTCKGIAYHSGLIPFETIMTVVARQFSLMNDAGYENCRSYWLPLCQDIPAGRNGEDIGVPDHPDVLKCC